MFMQVWPERSEGTPSDVGVTLTRDPCGMYVRQEALPVAPFAATSASCTAGLALFFAC